MKSFGVLLVAAALSLNAIAADDSKPAEQKQQAAPRAMPAPVMTVAPRIVSLSYEYPARLQSVRQVDVIARVKGTLLTQNFTEGEKVEKGMELFKIDPEKYQAIADKARAQVSVAEATLKNAERSHKRVQALYKDKAVSEQERDSALSTFEVAQAQLKAAKADLNDVLIDLGYTSVKAPISGIAGKKQQDVGDLVGSAEDNSWLVSITQLDPIYAEFSIPDTEAGKIKPLSERLKAQLIFENQTRYVDEGELDFFDVNINPESGTVALRAIFPNPHQQLLPGGFMRIELKGESTEPLVVIPQKAVMQSPQASFVYVVQDGKATVRPVQLGDTMGAEWIIRGGLNAGDQIIVDNLMKIRPNTPVQPMPIDAQTQKPGA